MSVLATILGMGLLAESLYIWGIRDKLKVCESAVPADCTNQMIRIQDLGAEVERLTRENDSLRWRIQHPAD